MHAWLYLLSAVVMVACSSGYDVTTWSCIVHWIIPVVNIRSLVAATSSMTRRTAAVEIPPPVFVAVVVVALNSTYVFIWTACKWHWVVVIINVSCPTAGLRRVMWNHVSAWPPPLAVFTTIIVVTFNTIHCESTITNTIQVPVEIVVVASSIPHLGIGQSVFNRWIARNQGFGFLTTIVW